MIWSLTRRHLMCFFRDRWAVLFSVLGALVLFVLYVLFLGKMQIDSLSESLPPEARDDVSTFVLNWVFSGILVTSAITVPQAGLGVLVEDRTQGRVKDFLVSPVSRMQLTFSYILAAIIITMVILTVEVVVGVTALTLLGHATLTLSGLVELYGVLILLTAAFSGIAAFLVTLVTSQAAMSGLASLVGTLAGFLAGAYIPPLALPDMVINFMNIMPFAPAAMLVRGPVAEPALEGVGFPPEMFEELQFGYGTRIDLFGTEITPLMTVAIIAAWGLVFGGIAMSRMRSVIR
ncbi:ABC-2 type transporter [Corynebacterium faecale]|uniref:ABC transporter permease n=1 Tax=Corynebacterium faecale TaxID=1758466 RepID=UPI0025B4A665|nr:ABC transporter permease [Corynebacterium faecale]WJY92597.1 ABC-2 type transporter [Corynebacterium faecale]